jgi:hypothetical protein
MHALLQNLRHAHKHTVMNIHAGNLLTEKTIQQKHGHHASQKNQDQTQSK